MTVEEYLGLYQKPDQPLTRDEKIAKAMQACDCQAPMGVAVSCCIESLPKISMVPVGESCPVQLPEAFVCPRHEIMEW